MKKTFVFIYFIIMLLIIPKNVFANDLQNFVWETSSDGNTYCYQNGVALKGIYEIEGKKYHFGENTGILKKGWSITMDKRQYYSDNNGILQEEWQQIEGNTYYFSYEKGMYKDMQQIDGINYTFNSQGILLDKWVSIGGNIYYYQDGKMIKGIHEIEGKKYHFGENTGILKKGWSITMDKRQYYSNNNGILQEGWQQIDGNMYYFNCEKGMYKGIYDIDGKRYHFGENTGILKKGWSITMDKRQYYSDSNGVILTGNQYIDGNWYAFDNSGCLKSGWQTINGKEYYFYGDGSRAKYICKIAGVRYEFSASGELQHKNIKVIADISKHQGYVDWDKLWSSGEIDGVILRVGYSLGMDSRFLHNLAQVTRLKIPYTIYHFSTAENAYEAQLEANHLIDWYRNNNLSLYMDVYYDIESWYNAADGHSSDTISVASYDSIISTYKAALNNIGIGMSVYTGKNYAETRLSDYGRQQIGWIAHYATDCGYKGSYRGWQYTSKGSLPGISGNVDLSIFYW